MKFSPFHTLPVNPPNRNGGRFSVGPMLEGLENTHPLPGFECSGHLSQLFQPVSLGSIFDAPSGPQYSYRTEPFVGNSLVCVLASRNAGANLQGQTRGFTSCCSFCKLGPEAKFLAKLEELASHLQKLQNRWQVLFGQHDFNQIECTQMGGQLPKGEL